MEEILDFVLRYKYLMLFALVFGEQIGLPVPSLPFLLAAGALIRSGQIDLGLALLVGVVASVISDVIWYQIGRRRGLKVLNLLCRISLEPDSCVRRTEDMFARHGARSLLVSKFFPGYNTAAPPLAGVFGMRFGRFLLFDAAGAVLWLGTFLGLGWAFGNQLENLVATIQAFGVRIGTAMIALVVGYVLYKYIQRRRFLHELRISRITPEELAQKLDAGEDVVVVDLRHSVDFEADPETVPGAVHVPVEDVEQRAGEIPHQQEVVLYCT